MAKRLKVHLRPGVLGQVERSPAVKAAVHAAAEQVGAAIEAEGIQVGDRDGGPYEIPLPVEVREGRIVLAHPAGEAVQAKHGSLTKAAAQTGLKLKDGGAR